MQYSRTIGLTLRANSRLQAQIGAEGYAFLEHTVGAVERILPHVEVSSWTEASYWAKPGAQVSRAVLVELASLDGGVVLNNSSVMLAFGAIHRPKKSGRLRGSEGSRTKAAIGSSLYGLAVKVSSDGDITVYHQGKEFICI